jgi:hypothetical protein
MKADKSKFKILIIPIIFLGIFFFARGVSAATYWVSPTGAAAWASCSGVTPLNSTSACSLGIANTNAAAGDTVYLRGGTYTVNTIYGAAIAPAHSGTCASSPCLGGVGANKITFSAYTGETPILQQANTTNIMVGIDIEGKNWIKVTGITFKNFTFYLADIEGGSSYNEISYNQFTADSGYEPGVWFDIGGFNGTAGWSVHNWIHHNYISKKQSNDPCAEAVDLVRIGNAETNPTAADDYNTFENNYLEYGGHSTLYTSSKHNVVKDNIAHNEPWISGCMSWQQQTSASSLTIGTGSKSLITQTGLGSTYAKNYPISIIYASDYSQVMGGTVTSYDSGTGALVVNVTASTGSGTYSSWILSQKNVPYYINSAYNGLYGHRNFAIGDSDPYNNNLNLVEGNRIGFGSTNPGNGGSTNLDLESPGNIVRYNFIYGGMDSGIYFKWANGSAGTGGVRNYVFNNTIYHNGYGWNTAVYGGMNVAYNGEGIAQFTYGGNTNNVVKNNIAFGNSQGDICSLGWHGNNTCTPSSIDTVINNWLTNVNGDPKFTNPDLSDPTSQNLFSSVHGYTANPIPDLTLQSGSGAIDGGTYLTTANGSGSNSISLVVADAFYFQDGTWGSDLARGVTMFPDWIAVGTVNNTVQISSINYSTNTITLASPISWSNGDHIWLYKNSSGTVVLSGTAPDIGAYEYVQAAPPTDTTPPAAPTGVSVQ